jgi:hypothetical protein
MNYHGFIEMLAQSGVIDGKLMNHNINVPYAIEFKPPSYGGRLKITGVAIEINTIQGNLMIIYFGGDQELVYYTDQFDACAFYVYNNGELIVSKGENEDVRIIE